MSDNKLVDLVSNRRATYDFEVLETFEAGIVLQGTEVKSLRDNGGSLQEAYVKIIRGEAWLIGCNIAVYRFGNIHNHETRRDKKLLLHKRELEQLKVSVQQKGLTIIPLAMYLKKGRIKLRIAIGKGKKNEDKRHSIREREDKRQIAATLKKFR